MSISINPIFPVIAAQGAAPDLVLQPGTVIDAEVLKARSPTSNSAVKFRRSFTGRSRKCWSLCCG
jgi:hypothetical protein